MSKFNSELLLPAGSIDSFRAAIKGGADAVYLGLKQFNARVRANNFGNDQLAAIIKEAKNHNVLVYITLNTVIKNAEIPQVLDFLATLELNKVDAVIIQDWGVYYLAKKHFPNLVLHASTQMGNHNSLGVAHCHQLGFERCVLARELNLQELEKIAKDAQCELEVFVHGALCYSFSGMCLFSSYIGGRGANRGMCSQACRMNYQSNKKNALPFNLKDNEQISQVQKLQEIGIHSLKIEGRMKSAEYVYRVARAYRMALDQGNTKQAAALLELDFARSKTGYFLNNDLSNAIANNSNTGIQLGHIISANREQICFQTDRPLQEGDRIRIQNKKSKLTSSIKLENIKQKGEQIWCNNTSSNKVSSGDQVFWIGRKESSFPSRLIKVPPLIKKLSPKQKQNIIKQLASPQSKGENEIYIRIDSLDWLEYIRTEETQLIILSLSKRQLQEFNYQRRFIQKHSAKIALELPKFIGEMQLAQWKEIVSTAHQNGIRHFVLSHLSQQALLPAHSQVTFNEQVYIFNDAAAKQVAPLGNFCYPAENDWKNLQNMQNTSGIVPLYSKPELFYSRMPIKGGNEHITDSHHNSYSKKVIDGITIIHPEQAVSHTQHKNKLTSAGFHRFLFCLKHQAANPKTLKEIFQAFAKSKQMANTNSFNFSQEMQ